MAWGHNPSARGLSILSLLSNAQQAAQIGGAVGAIDRLGRRLNYSSCTVHCVRMYSVRLGEVSSVQSYLPVETSTKSGFGPTALSAVHVTDTALKSCCSQNLAHRHQAKRVDASISTTVAPVSASLNSNSAIFPTTGVIFFQARHACVSSSAKTIMSHTF